MSYNQFKKEFIKEISFNIFQKTVKNCEKLHILKTNKTEGNEGNLSKIIILSINMDSYFIPLKFFEN